MIRAVVYCAEWDLDSDNFCLTHPDEPPPQPPAELMEWYAFRRYGLPPNGGGLRDQPLGWMDRCEYLDSVYRAWASWMAGDKSPEWVNAHPREYGLARWLREYVYGK